MNLAFILLLSLSPGLSAVEGRKAAAVSLTPESRTIEAGRPFRLAGSVRLPPGASLKEAPVPREDARFSVLGVRLDEPRQEVGSVLQTFELEAAAFTVGRATFPALTWHLAMPDGSTRALRSPPVPFDVEAPAGNRPDADIRGLRPAVRVFDPARYVRPALVVLLLLALAAAAWGFRRRRPAAPLEPEVPLTAYEEAVRRLDALEASGLWESGDRRGYYIELADLLRDYLERRFSVPATHETTRGLVRALKADPAAAESAAAVRAALEDCDLVKFARSVPTPGEKAAAVARVRGILESTTPAEERSPEAEGAAA